MMTSKKLRSTQGRCCTYSMVFQLDNAILNYAEFSLEEVPA